MCWHFRAFYTANRLSPVSDWALVPSGSSRSASVRPYLSRAIPLVTWVDRRRVASLHTRDLMQCLYPGMARVVGDRQCTGSLRKGRMEKVTEFSQGGSL
jgi:hypothetical protein